METSCKHEPCQRLSFLNYSVHTFGCLETPQGQFPPILRHLAAEPFPTALPMGSELLSRCTYLFFPRAPQAPPELCAYNSGGLGHLTCHVMLHNYIPDPGFQHLKSSKPR